MSGVLESANAVLGPADAGHGDQSGGLYLTEGGGQTWQRIGGEGPLTFGGYLHPKHEGWIYTTPGGCVWRGPAMPSEP